MGGAKKGLHSLVSGKSRHQPKNGNLITSTTTNASEMTSGAMTSITSLF